VQNLRKWCTEFASYMHRIFSFFGAEFWQPYLKFSSEYYYRVHVIVNVASFFSLSTKHRLQCTLPLNMLVCYAFGIIFILQLFSFVNFSFFVIKLQDRGQISKFGHQNYYVMCIVQFSRCFVIHSIKWFRSKAMGNRYSSCGIHILLVPLLACSIL